MEKGMYYDVRLEEYRKIPEGCHIAVDGCLVDSEDCDVVEDDDGTVERVAWGPPEERFPVGNYCCCCMNFNGNRRCSAFRKIPSDIWYARKKHDKVEKDQFLEFVYEYSRAAMVFNTSRL